MNDLTDLITGQKGGRGELIPLLQGIQESEGYLSQDAITRVSGSLHIPLSEVYGMLTFYSQFRLKPSGKNIVKVCHGTACHVGGSEGISQALENELKITHGDTTPDGKFTLERVACLGCCSLAPCIMINNETYGRLTSDKAREILRSI